MSDFDNFVDELNALRADNERLREEVDELTRQNAVLWDAANDANQQRQADQPDVVTPQPLNVDGTILSDGRVMLIGTATWDGDTGKYRCLANVEGALCVVEIKVTPRAANPTSKVR